MNFINLVDPHDLLVSAGTVAACAVSAYLYVTFPRRVHARMVIKRREGHGERNLGQNHYHVLLYDDDAFRYLHSMVINGAHEDMAFESLSVRHDYFTNPEKALEILKEIRSNRFSTAAMPWRALSWIGF